ncbi:hypothetical protein B0T25DRAFT_534291 [Lasiosphaeria hispida]|uniref:Uncharacterized protein n=1 Tax=Lasiosphaeria hispida TaxID=260671 RepID=A0AAJ0HRL0_9PEZI|nr:hypothetical protein B0T25DRAFT_534291 [Lasiosphaeria hispida]
MSTTTKISQQDYLQDYTIRLTGGEPTLASSVHSPSPPPAVENPPDWPTDYRQVPSYRPINYELDRESRPWGSNPVEAVIIFTMMHGVWFKGSVSWLWRNTGGRFNEAAFTERIGGET